MAFFACDRAFDERLPFPASSAADPLKRPLIQIRSRGLAQNLDRLHTRQPQAGAAGEALGESSDERQ